MYLRAFFPVSIYGFHILKKVASSEGEKKILKDNKSKTIHLKLSSIVQIEHNLSGSILVLVNQFYDTVRMHSVYQGTASLSLRVGKSISTATLHAALFYVKAMYLG